MGCISEEYFPGYSKETTKLLCEFLIFFKQFVEFQISNYEIHLSLICAFVNIFHITVLLQKSMRTSSIHLIMAAIAFTDLCSLTYAIQRDMIVFYHDTDLCYSKTTDYIIVLMQMIADYVRNFSRRCSTWLSLSITLVRALVLQYPTNVRIKTLSSPKAACFIISGIIFMIISLNILEVFRYQVTVFNKKYECGEDRFYFRYYWYDISGLFQKYDILEDVYKRIDAIVSKMIPCVLFPIVTFVLIRGIRKTNNSRQKMASNSAAKNHANTSYLVLAQTLTFFIAEVPLGIIFMMESLYDSDQYGKHLLLVYFEIFFSFLLAGTTATHMIICVLMSTQYRSSASIILRFGYPYKTIFLCYSKNTDYILLMSQIATDYIRNYGRRCSTWLSLSITTLRALVIRYPMNTSIGKLSNPKAAFYIIIGVILTIIPINIMDAFRLDISLHNENFRCGWGFGPRYYIVGWSELYRYGYGLIIPCCLFPFVTFILIREIRMANTRRNAMASTVAAKNQKSTSYLVLAQTLVFFIAELPLGIILFVQSLLVETWTSTLIGEYKILDSLIIFFEFFLSASTMCHMIICMLMSSQYRMNALMFVRAGYPLKEKKAEVTITVTQPD